MEATQSIPPIHLSPCEREDFWRDGYLLVKNVLTADELASLQREFDGWVVDSRQHDKPWGVIADGRPRFDLEPGHSALHPALRRVNSPTEISAPYDRVMAESRVPALVADLVGPNVKFHHAKINSKLPGAATLVKWHQDFPFTPHSNDDLVTALIFVDEVTAENGPLEVVAGSHKGPLHELWHEGRFTGAVDTKLEADMRAAARQCVGPAGSVCFMHTRLLHGSAPNRSPRPRTLFICVYSAEDAVPLSPNPLPSTHEGRIVQGERTGRVRCVANELRLPQLPKQASFFAQQAASYDG
ncbi:phytanoyl-CoA dioxygenase family protein [Dongia sp.]|uniref:phytanoyl-CoA dioxygenase family protein n=1 Tax=Dongia sp. TaxID=1977262 RepID=UPI0035B30156